MKYRLLVLALIVIAAGAYIYITTTGGGKFDVGMGPSLLYFREDTWPICQKFDPVVNEVEKQYKRQIKFIRVDMATERGKDLAGQYYVFGTPVIIMFKGGKEVGRLMSYQSPESLTSAFDDLLEK
jgi:thioredoxin-like negative regulator of GroEL